jgi:DNA repair exonuclease SbcCD ATPase subunit
MKLLRLYIKDFVCYEGAYIDFSEFNSAVILGKRENNDNIANGVGKSTIFNAIEYILFNQSEVPLEELIRDDTPQCRVVLDFLIDDQEYRLARTRTKKGSTDLVLLQRNGQEGTIEEVYHTVASGFEIPWIEKKHTEKYWKDLSGSRSTDTEKDLAKLIKINHKSFLSTTLFPQNDMTGLATATPANRKAILKDALNLAVYVKLEKIAKEKFNALSKEAEKNALLISGLGDPQKDLVDYNNQLQIAEKTLEEKKQASTILEGETVAYEVKIGELNNQLSNLEAKFSSLVDKEKSLQAEKKDAENSLQEYQKKKADISKSARSLIAKVDALKEQQAKLVGLDFAQIEILAEAISALKAQITVCGVNIKRDLERCEELKIPMPDGAVCKHCRQSMNEEHRQACKDKDAEEIKQLQVSTQDAKRGIVKFTTDLTKSQQDLNNLNVSKHKLDKTDNEIASTDKEILSQRAIFDDYSALLDKFNTALKDKEGELVKVQGELSNSSLEEAKVIRGTIDDEKRKKQAITDKIAILNKELNHYSNSVAVIQHTIEQKTKDAATKEELEKQVKELDVKLSVYPSVVQSFSSTGIPKLIIQTVLDDLQIEANNLLSQLRPDLQLSFATEKTRTDGDQADTLDIQYYVNGKKRYYKALSGAMRLSVAFSLKLGLSFLLQKMLGVDLKFLLLDEIDQPLDKASIDALVNIIKFFQKDLTILIITHNDRMNDKFSHTISVEQDINMVSKARVVSSW